MLATGGSNETIVFTPSIAFSVFLHFAKTIILQIIPVNGIGMFHFFAVLNNITTSE
jgi:hypothetical protein